MKEVLFEILYVVGFVGMICIMVRHHNLKLKQIQRNTERKKELERRDLDLSCKMVREIYCLEKKKANRQSITIKGALAEKLLIV